MNLGTSFEFVMELDENFVSVERKYYLILTDLLGYLQALCAVLEYEICDSSDLKMQIITTLQSTSRGKRMYADLCERQIQLRELVSVVNELYHKKLVSDDAV